MFDWSRVWLIAKRELTLRFKQRSYRWTTIVQVVIIALLALAPVLVAKFGPDNNGDDGESSARSVVVVDEADANLGTLMPLYLDAVSQDMTLIEVDTAETADAARLMVDDGDADAALIATRDDSDQLVFDLINEDGESSSLESQRIIAAASAAVMQDRIESSGLSASDAEAVFTPPSVTVTSASGEESSGATAASVDDVADDEMDIA